MPVKPENLKTNPCSDHNLKKLRYIDLHNWTANMVNAGHEQEQCPKCKRWLFKCEQ